MINKISDFFLAIAGWKTFTIGLIIYLAFGAYVMPKGAKAIEKASGKKVEILDLQFSYSPDKARAIINSYGEEGRPFVAKFSLIADTIYPVVYTFLFVIIIAWIFKSLLTYGVSYKHIHLFPFAIILADYCENAGIITMLKRFPDFTDTLVYISSFFTSLKWSLLGVQSVIILAALGTLIYYRYVKK